jgi:hypothetical protein
MGREGDDGSSALTSDGLDAEGISRPIPLSGVHGSPSFIGDDFSSSGELSLTGTSPRECGLLDEEASDITWRLTQPPIGKRGVSSRAMLSKRR